MDQQYRTKPWADTEARLEDRRVDSFIRKAGLRPGSGSFKPLLYIVGLVAIFTLIDWLRHA